MAQSTLSFHRQAKSSLEIKISKASQIKSQSKENTIPGDLKKIPPKVLRDIFNKHEGNPTETVENLLRDIRSLEAYDVRPSLEQYCLDEFVNLPLILLFEVAAEFNLQNLQQMVRSDLVNENYEQLNYLRYHVVKLSLPIFKKLLNEYWTSVNNVEISGLKYEDIKSIIDDYCVNSGMDDEKKQQLYSTYLRKNQIISQHSEQTRRSMVNLQKPIAQNSLTPIRPKKQQNKSCDRSNSVSSGHETFLKKMNPYLQYQQSEQVDGRTLCNEIKAMIKQNHENQNELYEEIVETAKEVAKDPKQRQINKKIANIEKLLHELDETFCKEENKIEILREEMEKMGPLKKEMDFVFKY